VATSHAETGLARALDRCLSERREELHQAILAVSKLPPPAAPVPGPPGPSSKSLTWVLVAAVLGLAAGAAGGYPYGKKRGGAPPLAVPEEIASLRRELPKFQADLAERLGALANLSERLAKQETGRQRGPAGATEWGEPLMATAQQALDRAVAELTSRLAGLDHVAKRLHDPTDPFTGGPPRPGLDEVRDRLSAIERMLEARGESPPIAPPQTEAPRIEPSPQALTEASLVAPLQAMPWSQPAPVSFAEPSPARAGSADGGEPRASLPPPAGRAADSLLHLLQPAWPELGRRPQPLAVAHPGVGEGYLSRLLDLEERARQRLGSGWRVRLVHVRIDGARGTIFLHRVVERRSLPSGASVVCSCGESLVQIMLFQLALQMEPPEGEHSALTLPDGPFAASNFPAAYQRLLRGPLPAGRSEIERVVEPAVLRQLDGSPDAAEYAIAWLLEAVFR
jgi:hypothetical protein